MVRNVDTVVAGSVADRGDLGLCPVNVPLTCYSMNFTLSLKIKLFHVR